MSLKYTLKKKDYDKDERTLNAEEFMQRLLASSRGKEQLQEIPKTEILK